MSILEILQFCALHGVSVMFHEPSPEGGRDTFPGGVPSVAGQLKLSNAVEIVFAAFREDGRPQWHVVCTEDMARDAAAFEEVFRRGFETFCSLAGVEPRMPTLWGRPVVRMEVKDIDLRPLRNLPENRLTDWKGYAGVDWAKKEEGE